MTAKYDHLRINIDEYCQEHGIDGDYSLASLITAKTFEMNNGDSDD